MDSLPLHPAHVDKSQPAEPRHETLHREGQSLAEDLEKPETLKTGDVPGDAWPR